MSDTVEITLEANPTSVEAEKFKAFRAAGVNRVSLGVQALNAQDLKFLGREHSADEALGALALARETFPRMSFDLIYARPGQTVAAWETELTRALTYADGHLSLYQLTIEENTAFHHAYHSGKFTLPDEEVCADMFELTQDMMKAHGLPGYEISNHARPGQESRHNLVYWRGEDAIGIGPGAHGRYSLYDASCYGLLTPAMKQSSGLGRANGVVRMATEIIKSPERWLEKVEQSGTGLISEVTLSERERFEEAMLMGLRLAGGIDYNDWQKRMGFSLHEQLPQAVIIRLQQMDMLEADEHHIAVTDKGRLLLNRITADLLAV